MKIIFTEAEAEEMFYNALCNAVGSGYMDSYGLEMRTNKKEHETAKAKLIDKLNDSRYQKTFRLEYVTGINTSDGLS